MSSQVLRPPAPRFGRESNVDITSLLDTKMVAQKWKNKLAKIRNQHGTLVKHNNSLKKPKITTLDFVKPENASLMSIVGGRHVIDIKFFFIDKIF